MNQPAKMPTPKSPPMIKLSQDKPSRLRSFLALLLASLALFFASLAILSFWTERTLTDTDNFAGVVGPLAKSPEIQKLAAEKLTDVITEQATQNELAQSLLGAVPPNINSSAVQTQVNQRIQIEINKVLSSEKFSALWDSTTRDLHQQVIGVLSDRSGNQTTVISYEKTLKNLLDLLKTTELKQLGPVELQTGSGQIKIKSNEIKGMRDNYQRLISIDTLALALALVLGGLAVLTANYRLKMVRKLAIGLAVSAGFIALVSLVATNISVSGANIVELKAGQAVLSQLLSELIKLSIAVSLASAGVAVAASILIRKRFKKAK